MGKSSGVETHQLERRLSRPEEEYRKEVRVISGTAAFQQAKLLQPPRPFTRRQCVLYMACFVCFLCSTVNGYDGSLLNSLLENENFLKHFDIENKGLWTGIVSSMYTIGGVAALPFIGPILDNLGRRSGLFVGGLLIIGGTIVQVLTVDYASRQLFMTGRFLLGFGASVITSAGPILVMEIAHPAYRGIITAWYNTFWFTGSILASGAARATVHLGGTQSWVLIVWLQCLFAGICTVFAYVLPESPRWLYVHGKATKAKEMLVYWHGEDDPHSVWVNLQLVEYAAYLDMDGSDKRFWDYSALFNKRSSVYRVSCNLIVVIFGQWAGNSVLSYFLGSVLDTAGYHSSVSQMNITLVLSIVQFITAVTGARFVDSFGRRPLLLFAMGGCALTWVGMTIATWQFSETRSKSSSIAALALIYLFDIVYSFGITPLQALYPVEVLSFEMRAKGMAFSNLVMNAAILLNNFAWPVAMDHIGYRTYIVFAAWDVIQTIVIYLVLPETKGRTLEELDDVFNARNPRKASTQRTRVAFDSDTQIIVSMETIGGCEYAEHEYGTPPHIATLGGTRFESIR